MASDLRCYATANARARGLLATLLGRSGLETLYGYPTKAAMLDALARTSYAPPAAMPPVCEGGLGERLAAVGCALLASLGDPERAFLRQYLLHHEIANLKTVIRAVHHRIAREDVIPHLMPLPGIATVDPLKLLAARDARELIELLGGSAYAAALRSALHRLQEAGSFALEVAVEIDYYERLWSATDSLRRRDAERARTLLGVMFDVLNLTWIARHRDALRLSPEEILNYTLRQGCWITIDIRRDLAENPGVPWAVALAGTPYGPLLEDTPPRSFDASSSRLWRFLALQIQGSLAAYPFHIGVPFGFLLAQEIEIRDLRVLLAGKSIGVPPADALNCIATVRH